MQPKIQPQTEETESLAILKEMIRQNGGILIGMVHESLYGPLRGLNFILRNPKPETVEYYMTEGMEQICFDVWKETMMAARAMVLPYEMISQMEAQPKEFDTIKEGEDHIRRILKKHSLDVFYFRMGIL